MTAEDHDGGLYYVLLMDSVPHRPYGDFTRADLEPKLQEWGVAWTAPSCSAYIFEVPTAYCEHCRQWLQELGYDSESES